MEKSVGVIGVIIYLAFILFMLVAFWKIFTKAGKPGWAILIPIYNIIVMLEIGGKPWWWLLLMMFVPIANVVMLIWMLNMISLSFGKTSGFTIGMLFLPFIFFPILGYGKATYQGPAGEVKS